MYGIIYKVENKVNGKVYIGQTIYGLNKRKLEHINDHRYNSIIGHAIRKYGKENFNWNIIDEANNKELLDQLERLHISRYESLKTEWGYNIKDGGANGKHLKETKQKISNTLKNNPMLSKPGKNNPMFGKTGKYPGVSIDKRVNPENKPCQLRIKFKGKTKHLGMFEDPISASIVYKLVKDEIYREVR